MKHSYFEYVFGSRSSVVRLAMSVIMLIGGLVSLGFFRSEIIAGFCLGSCLTLIVEDKILHD